MYNLLEGALECPTAFVRFRFTRSLKEPLFLGEFAGVLGAGV